MVQAPTVKRLWSRVHVVRSLREFAEIPSFYNSEFTTASGRRKWTTISVGASSAHSGSRPNVRNGLYSVEISEVYQS